MTEHRMRKSSIKQIDTTANGLVEKVRPIFAGQHPQAVGAALGELMATHLLGHHVLGHPEAQTVMRKDLFVAWCHLVSNLMDHYENEEEEPTIQ